MSADEWEEIKTLFSAAMILPEQERAPYLARACADKSEILRTVLDLLSNHQDSESASHSQKQAGLPVLTKGDIVAHRYRVVRFIARGGMGV
jgi:hypothetical protein